MKPLEDALRSYVGGDAGPLFMENMRSLFNEAINNQDFITLIDTSMEEIRKTTKISARDEHSIRAVLVACVQAGVTIGIEMERNELTEQEAQ